MMTGSDTGLGPENQGATGGGVLRRLLSARAAAARDAGQAPQLPSPAPRTAASAAATAVGRAVERLYHVAFQPIGVTAGGCTLAELPELLPAPALYAVVEGEAERMGVLALCPESIAAVIELQALGRITARAPERRRMTRSDAMLCADFVNAVLAEMATEMSGIDGFEGWGGYRYASYLDDSRPLLLMLEDVPFRSLSMRLKIGGDQGREVTLFFALPQAVCRTIEPPSPEPPSPEPKTPEAGAAETTPPHTDSATEVTAAIAAAVQTASVELTGVLCRKRMSLAELRTLLPGKSFAIPRACLEEARLETVKGQVLARGKVGESDGCYAIRLAGDAGSTAIICPIEPPLQDLQIPDAFRPEPDEVQQNPPDKQAGR